MDPKLRQRAAAEYLGIAVRTFRSYAIKPPPSPRITESRCDRIA